MASLHWELHNHFAHYGGPGLEMLGFDAAKPFVEQFLNTLPFEFDSLAKQNSFDALMSQLPARIHQQFRDGVTFARLFAHITNETPATSEHIRDVLEVLIKDHEIQLRDEYGRPRRRRTRPSNKDIVIIAPQQKLSFP